jgi:hypothetical protein
LVQVISLTAAARVPARNAQVTEVFAVLQQSTANRKATLAAALDLQQFLVHCWSVELTDL